MRKKQVVGSMTGASPVTTILTDGVAGMTGASPVTTIRRRNGVAPPRDFVYSSDRACPCHAPTRPLRTDVISVLLVDDHALVREGLRQLFTLQEDIQVVGEAADGVEALHTIRRLRPDIVLMDIHLPIVDGIAVTRQVTHEIPTIAVIMLTMHRDQQHMVQALKSGARGYLLKSSPICEVAQAIRTVHAGGMLIEPEMTNSVVSEPRHHSELPSKRRQRIRDLLTEKELEIVRYVAMGMSNKEIAVKLVYSEKTVKNYLSIIFQKLNIRDRTQAAILALRQGILSEETF